jgi:hypothetical protein
MTLVIIALIYTAAFSITTGVIARSKNRDYVKWLWLGAFGGIFALVAVCAMPPIPTRPTDEWDHYMRKINQ